jgi:hypothetical protein
MAVNDFEVFATDPLANVMSQAAYTALAARTLGFQAGIANSSQLNKTWRQSAFMASVLAQYIANVTGNDVLDDGDAAGKLALLVNAITTGANIKPARVVTVSTALTIVPADYAVGLARVAAPAAVAASLPAGAANGQEFVLEDLVRNFNAFPVTVSPPGGDNIIGRATFVCNLDGGSWTFRKYVQGGSSTWSVKS